MSPQHAPKTHTRRTKFMPELPRHSAAAARVGARGACGLAVLWLRSARLTQGAEETLPATSSVPIYCDLS